VWFYSLCGVGVLGLAMWLYQRRVARLRTQYMAVFAERSRLARELHDSLLQAMSAVAMQLRGVRKRLAPAIGQTAAAELEKIEDVVTVSLEETRRFVWNLREQPTGSGDLGLALDRLAGRLCQGRSVTCDVEVEGTPVHLPHDVQGQLFRIAQEALANALKHAEAQHIQVRLCYEGGRVRLSVADDGRGFDQGSAQGAQAGHFGLVGMRERAERIGSLAIDSRPGAGTRIEVMVNGTGAAARDV
jgi:signal transduction histidine kinase